MANGQTKVAFVNYQYLVDNSPIYSNLDPEDINWLIAPSQDINIERLLGTKLYQKIKDDVVNNTLAGVYKTLLDDYVNPSLVFFIAFDAIDFNAIHFTNKGLLRKSSDNSEVATSEELQTYKDKLSTMAEYYGNRIVEYLCANTTDFPEYTQSTDEDDIVPANSGYKSTIFIPGKGGVRRTYDNPKYRVNKFGK